MALHNTAITENFTAGNTHTVTASFAGQIAENLNPADSITVIASFTSQSTENLVLLDNLVQRGWIAINDDQNVVWVPVYNNYP